jgi:hypothetical protein
MDKVTVDLRDGFYRDEVILSVPGGAVLARESGVTTRTQIGFARSIELPLPAAATRIRLEIPARGMQRDIDLPPARPLWIGISLRDDGEIEARIQQEPFGYL